MTAFAIFRVTKLKNFGAVEASTQHMLRTRDTPNADPTRAARNGPIVGGNINPVELVRTRVEDVTTKQGRPLRKNGVVAVEVLMTASPEWFKVADLKTTQREWVRRSRDWLTKTFGSDNVVSLFAHDDETTFHLTGFVVPVDPSTGRLNASRWLDGRDKLSRLQTDYAKSVADLGLSRGQIGSNATHQSVQQFYGYLSADVGTVEVPPLQIPPVFGREEWAIQERERLASEIAPRIAAMQAQARAGLVQWKRVKDLQTDATSGRALAARVRETPLTTVLSALALARDPKDQKQWRDAEGRFRITVEDERRFYNHAAGRGGGGAIDLAMHVLETDFQGSVAWLAGNIGGSDAAQCVAANALRRAKQTVAAAQAERPPFELPKQAPDRRLIKAYLCNSRRIDQDVVDHLIDNQQLVSDERGNVGFVMRDAAGVARGLELKGTSPTHPFTGLAPGSSREATFRLQLGDGRTAPRVVLTESGIDVLSFLQLYGSGDAPCLIASTSGARSTLPASLKAAVEQAPEVAVAYDNDRAGDAAATRLLQFLATCYRGVRKRLRSRAKDWNDDARGLPPLATVQRPHVVRDNGLTR